MTAPIVAIDGPSGVGKSSTSKLLAGTLGLPHIDTGAMYRAIALKATRMGVPLDDADNLAMLASDSTIEFAQSPRGPRTMLDGDDVSEAIREPQISMAASTISAVPAVRRVLVRLQQEMGRRNGGVLEGRDIGTKVFPGTPYKFFLTARPEVRALRRHRELQEKGVAITIEQVLAEMIQRDEQDSTRADSPLSHDSSYTVVDTSDLTMDQVVALIVSVIEGQEPHRSD